MYAHPSNFQHSSSPYLNPPMTDSVFFSLTSPRNGFKKSYDYDLMKPIFEYSEGYRDSDSNLMGNLHIVLP